MGQVYVTLVLIASMIFLVWGPEFATGRIKKSPIGSGKYTSYSVNKLRSRFLRGQFQNEVDSEPGFEDWNRLREKDGFLCREDRDCLWIDSHLYCYEQRLNFVPNWFWFLGAEPVRGVCACPEGAKWDNDWGLKCN